MALRIDAHQHFWRYTPEAYPWISEAMPALRRDFGPGDLKPLLDAAKIDGSIVVQARSSREETRFLLDMAATAPWIRGVVAWIDLRASTLAAELEHDAANFVLKGYRHQVQDEASPSDFLADAAFNRGVDAVLRLGKVYEILIHSRDMDAATKFCARHEGQLVLDHLGKPDVQHEPLQIWRSRIKKLAALPHVSCKLSGLITEAAWDAWTPEKLLPYLATALDCFGPDRLLFGSDWPVCLLAGTYPQVQTLLEKLTASLSPDEQAAIWGKTACRIYGL